MVKHFTYDTYPKALRKLWLKHKNSPKIAQVVSYSKHGLIIGSDFVSWANSSREYTFEDGTPFGVDNGTTPSS